VVIHTVIRSYQSEDSSSVKIERFATGGVRQAHEVEPEFGSYKPAKGCKTKRNKAERSDACFKEREIRKPNMPNMDRRHNFLVLVKQKGTLTGDQLKKDGQLSDANK